MISRSIFYNENSKQNICSNSMPEKQAVVLFLNNFQNIATGENSFKWSDHSPVVYTKWGTNQPQVPPNNQGCVLMNRYGAWGLSSTENYPVSCTQTSLPYVCKHETRKISSFVWNLIFKINLILN